MASTPLPSIEKLMGIMEELEMLVQLSPDEMHETTPEWATVASALAQTAVATSTNIFMGLAERSKRPREEDAEPPALEPKAKKARRCEACELDLPGQRDHSCLHKQHVAAGTTRRLLRYDYEEEEKEEVNANMDKLQALYATWSAGMNEATLLKNKGKFAVVTNDGQVVVYDTLNAAEELLIKLDMPCTYFEIGNEHEPEMQLTALEVSSDGHE